ncbi:hypothetical protein [Pseudarthrobacter sp. LMD1-1-1.1]|uniref:TY-Chap2 family putative peptide chaperone n=1 Tax=Pseudarthrobacter sp. LMD1-1-1.1 TaxID=3135242 RepID=UPI0039C947F9
MTADGGSAAHADALMMTSGSGTDYQARRRGLGFTAGSGGDFPISWDRAFSVPSARAIAMALEESQGIHRPEKSPPTSPRALGYRLMASTLELTLGDRLDWSTCEYRGGPLDPKSVMTCERLRDWEDTGWVLRRNGEPVAKFDNFGWLELDGRLINLHSGYRELDGRLYQLVLEVFGPLLP